jgi:hypothetical protein
MRKETATPARMSFASCLRGSYLTSHVSAGTRRVAAFQARLRRLWWRKELRGEKRGSVQTRVRGLAFARVWWSARAEALVCVVGRVPQVPDVEPAEHFSQLLRLHAAVAARQVEQPHVWARGAARQKVRGQPQRRSAGACCGCKSALPQAQAAAARCHARSTHAPNCATRVRCARARCSAGDAARRTRTLHALHACATLPR